MDRIKVLLWLILVCTLGCGGGENNTNDEAQHHYSLTVAVENGTAAITPDSTSYAAGTRVTIAITPDDGYDFYAWSGDHTGMANPLMVTMDSDMTITGACISVNPLSYYVDYDSGDDGNDGRSPATAWKHAPGDEQARDNPATIELEPGATIIFRGSAIYRGRIDIPADGSQNHPITYQGNGWPGEATLKAVIDGGDLISGWTRCESAPACGGNPDYENLYYAYLPAAVDPIGVNLHEYDAASGEDDFLWPAQDPAPSDPYFYDSASDFRVVPQSRLTRTSLTDADYFDQGDSDYWQDSYILVWVNPNKVVTRVITGFDPDTHTVSFDDLGEHAIYPDGRDQAYAVFNSLPALDNTIIRSGSTSLRLYGTEHAQLIGNTIAESKGSHANGITIYLHSRDILVANNRVYDSNQPITFQDSGNLFFINNVIDAGDGDNNVNEWGDTSTGPWERGTIAFFNNTLVRNGRNGALNIGASDENTYLVINNIIDGGSPNAAIQRSHNIYTGLSWSQSDAYGWSLGEAETVEEDLSLLFADPDAVPGDFHLTAQSPARGAGLDICDRIPAGLFPDFDCGTDFDGNRRSVWDIGAFAY